MNTKPTISLGEALPTEIARVRDHVMPAYQEIGVAGRPALFLMQTEMDAAARAMVEGDVVAMMAAYQALKEWTL